MTHRASARFQSKKWSWAFQVFTVALVFGGIALLASDPVALTPALRISPFVGVVLFLFAFVTDRWSRRAEVLLADGDDVAVLYLYSYDQKNISARTKAEGRIRLMELLLDIADPLGNCVKMGRGSLPSIGGARHPTVEDDDVDVEFVVDGTTERWTLKRWQHRILELASAAHVIVVMLRTKRELSEDREDGEIPGLAWEIDQIQRDEELMKKTIFVVPPTAGDTPHPAAHMGIGVPDAGRLIASMNVEGQMSWESGSGWARASDYAKQYSSALQRKLGPNPEIEARKLRYRHTSFGLGAWIARVSRGAAGDRVTHYLVKPLRRVVVLVAIVSILYYVLELGGH